MARQTQATVDLQALRANYQWAASHASDSKTMAVIKADAYGHGVEPVAQALEDLVPAFAVATVDEGLQLRCLTAKPILVMQGVFRVDELAEASHHKLTLMIHHHQQLELIQKNQLHQPLAVWLKCDSGMHRLGLPISAVVDAVEQLKRTPWVKPDVVLCSHLANASVPEDLSNKAQLTDIQALRNTLGERVQYSLANSAAILAGSEYHLDWNRPGIMLYGGAPFDDIAHPLSIPLKPVMTLETEVIALRDIGSGESVGYGGTWRADRPSRIATLAIGYADGYPRHAPSGTPIWIDGQRLPLVGRVSMDMITVDVTDQDSVSVGDRAELWGANISVNEVAEAAGTISYDLMTGLSGRVPRRYIN